MDDGKNRHKFNICAQNEECQCVIYSLASRLYGRLILEKIHCLENRYQNFCMFGDLLETGIIALNVSQLLCCLELSESGGRGHNIDNKRQAFDF